MITTLLVLGVAVVLPLALGGRWWRWVAAAACVAVSLLWLPTGWPAALLVAPWAATALTVTAAAVRRHPLDLVAGTRVLAAGYSLVAAGALAASRGGLTLFGIGEPIVTLTAVHYAYAGSAALVLAAAALRASAGRTHRVAVAAVALTAGAPPLVALGFVTGSAIPQVGGAVLLSLGVWLTASLQLGAVVRRRATGAARVLLAISGAAIWIPMMLALAWAAGQHWDVPALSIPDMVRTHGITNALAFVLCGLAGRRALAARAAPA